MVTNTGDLTLSNVVITDTLTDANSSSLSLNSGPTLTAGDASNLGVGAALTYQATHVITQQGVDSGSVINSIYAVASSPAGTNDVNDLSDDGNDNDGNTESDPTVIFISSPIIFH